MLKILCIYPVIIVLSQLHLHKLSPPKNISCWSGWWTNSNNIHVVTRAKSLNHICCWSLFSVVKTRNICLIKKSNIYLIITNNIPTDLHDKLINNCIQHKLAHYAYCIYLNIYNGPSILRPPMGPRKCVFCYIAGGLKIKVM